jgi:hypothetical protein
MTSFTRGTTCFRYACALGGAIAIGFSADLLISAAFSRQVAPQDMFLIAASALGGVMVPWIVSLRQRTGS